MSRFGYSALFAFCLSVVSISAVGCGDGEGEVIEDTRTQAEIDQEAEEYEEMMEGDDSDQVTE